MSYNTMRRDEERLKQKSMMKRRKMRRRSKVESLNVTSLKGDDARYA